MGWCSMTPRDREALERTIAHDYLDVQVEVVIDIVRDDLPGLRQAASAALSAG